MRPPLPSPDGRFELRFDSIEMRMSHWVDRPVLLETATGRALLDLRGADWSAEAARWNDDGRRIALRLRRYPGDAPTLDVTIDVPAATAEIQIGAGAVRMGLDEVAAWLERWYASHHVTLGLKGAEPHPE